MKNSDVITLTNQRIISFFKKHDSLDIEQTFLSFIDIMEKLYDSVNNNINNSVVENFLTNIRQINNKINSIDSNISSIKDDTLLSFSKQMSEFKRDYIENLKLNLTSNVSDKIEPLVKEQMTIFLERTTNILNETLPKNNKDLQMFFNETISTLNNEINGDTKRLLENSIDQTSLNNFISAIDVKMNNVLITTQNHVNATIASSEKRLDDRISNVKQTTDGHLGATNILSDRVNSLLQKMENSSIKGKVSENIMFKILHTLYPTSQIDHVGQQKETGDIILSRNNKPDILIENKNWNKNVVQEEVKKFIRDVEKQKISGIFLSQNFGIANKENFEINIHDNNVLVYVHEANNDPEKIKIAVDIIDHFKSKLDDLGNEREVDTIPKEKLDAINNEVQYLVTSRLSLITLTKEYNQRMIKQLEEIKLPSLEEFLNTRYATSCSKFVCEHCEFVAKNKAALAAHKRRCKKKDNQPTIENIIMNIDSAS